MSRKSKSRRLGAAVTPQHRQPPQQERRQPEAHALTHRWVFWLLPVLIALVTFVPFLPTLDNQFVNWDDDDNLVDNPHYRGLGWTYLRWMWTTSHLGHYAPLTWMTFGLDYLVWGLKPVGYHLSNLLLHAANAAVFYLVARRILGSALPGPRERGNVGLALSAAFAALLFAIHPLRVESVAWATERRDVLSGLFYLLTLLAYLRAAEQGERDRWGYWASVGLFVCALLSKSMAVSLPVVLLILDVYPLRHLGGARGWWGEPARWVYLEKIPFVLLALAASAIAFVPQIQGHNMPPLDELSVLGRLADSAYGLSFYLWKTVFPVNLSPLYELRGQNPWAPPFLLSYGVVPAITALALILRHRLPGLPAAWLAYVVILLPVLGIFQNGPQIAADRYTYVAGLGWALWVSAGMLAAWRRRSFLVTGLAAFLLLGLGTLTWSQVRVWHDSEKLWSHAIAIDPSSSIGQFSLGLALARQGRLVEAVEHYQTALRLEPDFADAHTNVGVALANQGKLAEAIEHYETGLRLGPDNAVAHFAWGNALVRQGKLVEAVEHYQTALRLKPDYANAHNNAGSALVRQGKLAEAIAHYEEALKIRPDDVDARINVGVALARQGKLAEAIEQYYRALQIQPDHADAHTNAGAALTRQGKLVEAIAHYEQALKIKPDHADAHSNMGAALAGQGKLAEAIEHYQQALRIKPDHADAHTNWGAALAQQGKLDEAIEHYRQALQIRPESADAHNHWGLALARQGKLAEAIEHHQQAVKLRPSFTEAQSNLVNALQRLGMGQADTASSQKNKKVE